MCPLCMEVNGALSESGGVKHCVCVCDLGVDPGMIVVGSGIRLKLKHTPNTTMIDCEVWLIVSEVDFRGGLLNDCYFL